MAKILTELVNNGKLLIRKKQIQYWQMKWRLQPEVAETLDILLNKVTLLIRNDRDTYSIDKDSDFCHHTPLGYTSTLIFSIFM